MTSWTSLRLVTFSHQAKKYSLSPGACHTQLSSIIIRSLLAIDRSQAWMEHWKWDCFNWDKLLHNECNCKVWSVHLYTEKNIESLIKIVVHSSLYWILHRHEVGVFKRSSVKRRKIASFFRPPTWSTDNLLRDLDYRVTGKHIKIIKWPLLMSSLQHYLVFTATGYCQC